MTQLQNVEIDSWESEKLKQLIEKKLKDFDRPKPDWVKKELQAEILFLRNEILPIVLNGTTLLFSEITRSITGKIHEAINADANAILFVIPLTDSNDDTIKIAVANPHRDNPVEGLEISIEANGRELKEIEL